MTIKKILVSEIGRQGYERLPSAFREQMSKIDALPASKKSVSLKDLQNAFK